jgi:two-component system response regulator NreC
MIRVVLVEDHHLVREGLRLVLSAEKDLKVVGEASAPEEAFELLEQFEPDVMLLDLTLGDTDAIPLLRSLIARDPRLKVIVVTMHRDAETVRQALLAGASGYIVKGAAARELIEAIRAVMRGERYLHSSVTGAVVADVVRLLQSSDGLTAREREILSFLGAGLSPGEIGRSIGISVHTVRRHIANIGEKLGLRGIQALARYAESHDLVRSTE